MAIVTENYYELDGRIFKRTYSDKGFCIRQVQTGFVFAEAIDPHDSTWTYEETDDYIGGDDEAVIDDENPLDYAAIDLIRAAKILIGEAE